MNDVSEAIFDLYGTLVDVHSVARRAGEMFAGRGVELSRLWRQKQLEYTWLLTLMDRYEPFERVTQRALTFTLNQLQLSAGETQRDALADEYLRLDPYPGTLESLQAMRARGLRLSVLSNGSERSIDAVLRHAGLRESFDAVHSVERVARFKPDPAAYRLVTEGSASPTPSLLFVSSNAWDVSGAAHFGFRTCWLNRSGQPFEELGQTPGMTLENIGALDRELRDAA